MSVAFVALGLRGGFFDQQAECLSDVSLRLEMDKKHHFSSLEALFCAAQGKWEARREAFPQVAIDENSLRQASDYDKCSFLAILASSVERDR